MPTTFWRTVTRFEVSKITPLLAARNALAMTLALAAGVALGKPTAGLIACIGALNVAYSDGTDPYRARARRMCAAAVLCALAVFAGGLFAHQEAIAIALITLCAFFAGMMMAVSTTAADIGTIVLVTLIVFSAHAMSATEALQSGALALGGGLLQTAFALALWPVHRYQPERLALAIFFGELARSAVAPPQILAPPPTRAESPHAQTALAGLSGDRPLEAERYLGLLSQAERIRLALMMLSRLRVRIGREREGAPPARPWSMASRWRARSSAQFRHPFPVASRSIPTRNWHSSRRSPRVSARRNGLPRPTWRRSSGTPACSLRPSPASFAPPKNWPTTWRRPAPLPLRSAKRPSPGRSA